MKKLTDEERQKLKEGIQKLEKDKAANEAKKLSEISKGSGRIIALIFIIWGMFRIIKAIGGILPDDFKQQISNLNTNTAETWAQKGALLAVTGSDAEALKCYDKALELDPGYAMAWTGKGTILVDDHHAEALVCFNKALELDPESIKPGTFFAWHGKGLSLTHLGNYAGAIECLDKALELKPIDSTIWDSKGGTLFLLNRYEEAVECHNKALEINPDFTYAYCGKGAALVGLKRYKEAKECLTKFVELWNPEDVPGIPKAKAEEAIRMAQHILKEIERAEY